MRGARDLAHRLGIPHLTLDLRESFRAGVVEPFLQGHRDGETPNPCVGCNGHVRLDAMLDLAGRLGAATLATGHYARLEDDGAGPLLRAAADPAKDQTYMLSARRPRDAGAAALPARRADQARGPRAGRGGRAAGRAQARVDGPLLPGRHRPRRVPAPPRRRGGGPGDVVDAAGAVLGRHRGHHGFTVGQRRGIDVAATEPLYVLAKDAATNRVTVGPRAELNTIQVPVRGATLHRDGGRVDRVRLRYHARAVPARIAAAPAPGRHRRLEIQLDEPMDGAAPGQTACLLDGDLVVGWATIAAGLTCSAHCATATSGCCGSASRSR